MNKREWFSTRFDELWPLARSITGPGLRKSLDIIKKDIPLEIEAISSGTAIHDWKVPQEWHIYEARLEGPDGEIFADFDRTNLAVMNYSEPVNMSLARDSLEPHLYTDPDVPNATPYVTSYYERNWGFCLPHRRYEQLPDGEYHVYIDSEFIDGELNYGHTILPGDSDEELLLSSYLCHPSLANNELSGPLVLTDLYRRIAEWDDRHYTYRFVVCPETIGSIAYLSRYGEQLRDTLAGGFVLTCLGGPNDSLSYKTSRREDTLIDRTMSNLNQYAELDIDMRSFTPVSGSDERQYCSPGYDLPVGQLARTVYGKYDAYHNSNDNKAFVEINSLVESAEQTEKILQCVEYAGKYHNQSPHGEPMLSKRNLYPHVNDPQRWSDSTCTVNEKQFLERLLTVLNYSDGTRAMVDIATKYGCSVDELIPVVDTLEKHGLLKRRKAE